MECLRDDAGLEAVARAILADAIHDMDRGGTCWYTTAERIYSVFGELDPERFPFSARFAAVADMGDVLDVADKGECPAWDEVGAALMAAAAQEVEPDMLPTPRC